jgi:hypothetical protein
VSWACAARAAANAMATSVFFMRSFSLVVM